MTATGIYAIIRVRNSTMADSGNKRMGRMVNKGKNKRASMVRYLSEQAVASEMRLPPDLVHRTFDAIWTGYPRLQIKHKTGKLVWQSDTTTRTFVNLARSIEDGTYVPSPSVPQVPSYKIPQVTVPIMEFARACEESIKQARNIIPLSGNNCRQGLMRFLLEVEVDGTVAGIRLDLACALVKRMPRLPFDAYGDIIEGAMTDRTGRKWILAYDMSEQLEPSSPKAGNIDHLVPRVAGGSSSLCNLHVMRLHSNSSKSDIPMPDISGEPQASIRVLRMLAAGCHSALEDGRMDETLGRRLLYVIREDLSTCMDMIPARKVIATIIGGMVHWAVPRGKGRHSTGESVSVARMARKVLSQAASGVIVSA